MIFTPAQQLAIEKRNSGILISAAAGSGKTAVLVRRIVKMIQEGNSIENFLIVTFTEAASAEMKKRIARSLFEAANKDENGGETRLREQAFLSAKANISTLHSFCLYLLRRNFHLLDIDPEFRIADEASGDMLLAESLEEAASNRYEKEDMEYLTLLRALGGKEDVLFERVTALYKFIMAQPNPFGWLKDSVDDYKISDVKELEANKSIKALLGALKISALIVQDYLEKARDVIPEELIVPKSILDNDIMQIRALQLYQDMDSFSKAVREVKFKTLIKWPRDNYQAEKKNTQAIRNEGKAVFEKIKSCMVRSMEEEIDLLNRLHPVLNTLYGFMLEIHSIYQGKKRDNALIDFNDMEHYALELLRDESVRAQLGEKFQYIMVDEYQDSSRIQEEIVNAVKGKNNLFLVGDVKQSIYSFRAADPEIFLNKQKEYQEKEDKEVLHLNYNFRSSTAVINGVNAVFSRIMDKELCEMNYDETQMLYIPGNKGKDESLDGAELHIIEKTRLTTLKEKEEQLQNQSLNKLEPADEDNEINREDDEEESAKDAEKEAALIAKRILSIMQTNKIYDDKEKAHRGLKFSDFAILLRAQKFAALSFARVLSSYGVPCYVQMTGGYFEAIEVQLFLNIIRVVDNCQNDIPLLSVMRSALFSFTLDDLVTLKAAYPDEPLYIRVFKYIEDNKNNLEERLKALLSSIEQWREKQRQMPLDMFLAWLMDSTGYYDFIGALPMGKERQRNLDAILNMAEQYQNSAMGNGLMNFLSYMDQKAKVSVRLGPAQAGAADVVRVLSMHGSKGLEFPVVFLACLGHEFSKTDLTKNLLFDRKIGIGTRLVVNEYRETTLLWQGVKRELSRKQQAEEMRILYVGMTRAKNRLILVGCIKNAKEKYESLKEITKQKIADAKSFLDWLMPVQKITDQFSLQFYDRSTISIDNFAQNTQPLQEKAKLKKEDIIKAFSWQYPYLLSTKTPTKRSVSDIADKTLLVLREEPPNVRKTMELTPAERGEAVHNVLRELNYGALENKSIRDYIIQEKQRMIDKSIITNNQAGYVEDNSLVWFFESSLGKRVLNAKRVERELDFSLEIKASEILESNTDDMVLLQGVIDCCFMEENEWILLDFKTDEKRDDKTPDKVAMQHKRQLELYRLALERLTNKPVKESLVVLLSYQCWVRV